MQVSKQNINFITASILIIFSLYIFTFYWIVTSPISSLSPEDTKIPVELSNVIFANSVALANVKSNVITHEIQSGSNTRDFAKIEQEIKQRVDRVSNLCKKYHLGRYKWANNGSNDLNEKEPPTPLYSFYFWNRERHLAWCPVYKAGSTSWLYNMLILAGYSEQELKNPVQQFNTLAREAYGNKEPDYEALNQSLKLLVVRDPFQRLISAYRDKLSNISVGHEHGTLHFYKKYGQKIVAKFRLDKTSVSQREPTWEEFVRYLLQTNLIHYADDHWLPAYFSCTPCLVDYDIIAKTETYSRDQEYIIYKAGLEGILEPRWNHQSHVEDDDGGGGGRNKIGHNASKLTLERDDTIVKKYFSQLTKSQIEGLYKKYWFDFELFGYDYKKYLKYGREG